MQTIIAASAEGNVVELVGTRRPSFASMVYPVFGKLWDSTRSGGAFSPAYFL